MLVWRQELMRVAVTFRPAVALDYDFLQRRHPARVWVMAQNLHLCSFESLLALRHLFRFETRLLNRAASTAPRKLFPLAARRRRGNCLLVLRPLHQPSAP